MSDPDFPCECYVYYRCHALHESREYKHAHWGRPNVIDDCQSRMMLPERCRDCIRNCRWCRQEREQAREAQMPPPPPPKPKRKRNGDNGNGNGKPPPKKRDDKDPGSGGGAQGQGVRA